MPARRRIGNRGDGPVGFLKRERQHVTLPSRHAPVEAGQCDGGPIGYKAIVKPFH